MCALLSLHGAFKDGLKKRVVHGYKKCGGRWGEQRVTDVGSASALYPASATQTGSAKNRKWIICEKPSNWVGPNSVLVGADPTRATHSCFKHNKMVVIMWDEQLKDVFGATERK